MQSGAAQQFFVFRPRRRRRRATRYNLQQCAAKRGRQNGTVPTLFADAATARPVFADIRFIDYCLIFDIAPPRSPPRRHLLMITPIFRRSSPLPPPLPMLPRYLSLSSLFIFCDARCCQRACRQFYPSMEMTTGVYDILRCHDAAVTERRIAASATNAARHAAPRVMLRAQRRGRLMMSAALMRHCVTPYSSALRSSERCCGQRKRALPPALTRRQRAPRDGRKCRVA